MKEDSSIARRKFLKIAGLTATLGTTFGFTHDDRRKKITNSPGSGASFPPVKVSPERVIRTVVGLRPYRPSGFVVKSERLNKKTIIHNYGHGGAGITLSWGTSKLAVDLALQTSQQKFAVLGCGVIGLSTARLLQRKGFQVTIYAKALPPETTSNIAGGFWFPTSVFDKDKVDASFLSQFETACRISHRMFQDYIGDHYGVWWMTEFSLGAPNDFPPARELYPDIIEHHDASTYFGFDYVQQFNTMMIEPAIYLNALLRDFYLAGGKVKVKSFESQKDVTSLDEPVIMNCTGLGAGKLFNDPEITPVRGQLNILMPQPEITYGYSAEVEGKFIYMLPRKDGILLGGTFQKGNWSLEPDAADSEAILKAHAVITKSMGG